MNLKRQAVPGNFKAVGRAIQSFAQDEDGVTAIEYALLGLLVAVGAVAGIGTLGSRVGAMWAWISMQVSAAM